MSTLPLALSPSHALRARFARSEDGALQSSGVGSAPSRSLGNLSFAPRRPLRGVRSRSASLVLGPVLLLVACDVATAPPAAPSDAGLDAAAIDVARTDAAALDAAPLDAAPLDAAPLDAAPLDALPLDAAPLDALPLDAAPLDALPLDAAPLDALPSDGSRLCTDEELAALEAEMGARLDEAAANVAITAEPDHTFLLEAIGTGRRFTHSLGRFTPASEIESASTSKWVTAVVIMELVDRGMLSLETRAGDLLPFWTETEVDLRDLLSFTSGFADEPRCVNRPTADFGTCVREIFDLNVATATPPGTVYQYSSSHMQVAGLMAVRAAGAASWREVFDDFRTRTGLFPSGRYDLPSLENPRLAGGMTWTAEEYLGFLRALESGSLLSDASRDALLANQRGAATLSSSPIFALLGEDWSYGLGNWLECRTATELGTYDCGPGERNSSPGAYGSYPFLDLDGGYFGILARQGGLGSADDGARLFRAIEPLVERWVARSCPI